MTLGSLFDGSGTCPLAAAMCGITPVWASEIEPYPIRVTQKNFPEMKHLGDITKINGAEIEPVDIVTFGSPCFPVGTLVNTADGMKPIEHVNVGEKVLSHTGAYRHVLDSRYTGTKYLLKLKAMGIDEIKATENHRFLIRKKMHIWDSAQKKSKRVFGEPQWTELKDICRGDYLCIPIIQTQENPLELSSEECWLIGRYIADGYTRNGQRPGRPEGSTFNTVTFCIGKGKEETFERHLTAHKAGVFRDKTATKYSIHDNRLCRLCEMCGKGAENKVIPVTILNLPAELLVYVIDGYMSGDGCYLHGRYKAATVSRTLAYSLGAAVAKAYHVPYCVYRVDLPATTVIAGRTVNQKPFYQVTFKLDSRKQDKAFYENGCIWAPINSVSETGEKKAVYDLTVAEDHSFCVLNVAVHNCQDLSVAGTQKGLIEGKRSNLFFEAIRIIKEMRNATHGKYPRYAVWENVPGALSSNQRRDFLAVLRAFVEAAGGDGDNVPEPAKKGRTDRLAWRNAGYIVGGGYSIAWRVLDAQYWGVPQRRRRIFLVCDFAGERAGEILFKREGLRGNFAQSREAGKEAAADAVGSTGGDCRAFHLQQDPISGRVSPCIGAQHQATVGVVYDITGENSNSMKSRTPDSCFRKRNVARTLDTFSGSPECNQGGNVVAYSVDCRNMRLAEEISGTLQSKENGGYSLNYQNPVVYDARGNGDGQIVPTLTGDHENRITDYTALAVGNGQLNQIYMTDTAGTLMCSHDQQMICAFMGGQGAKAGGIGYSETVSPTLKAAPSGSNTVPDIAYRLKKARRYFVRRLTPLECCRLQGFPDWWEDGVDGSDSARYKMWGNGMALPCVLYVMEGITDGVS
jgi:DNA (cytosine-5)-methyltransferase 1